ncbi:hypothetical protein SAMN05216324_103253 [Chryseobacterium limigenitum]|uniref:Uncharacterized protein n=1 Tax=Chryseobacterium limigenitum TaxID=1612149 RepID=A0A1K2IJ30_9FLAO|nr:hypothetical protein SAMN05216324_103253 [Chryseobacterium limigenitum]
MQLNTASISKRTTDFQHFNLTNINFNRDRHHLISTMVSRPLDSLISIMIKLTI